MKYQYYSQKPEFTVENIDIQTVSRPKDYQHSFKNGRNKYGFIYTVSGKMCDTFDGVEKESVYVGSGEVIFIPKGIAYSGTYFEENTKIKIIQFDISRGAVPSYLSKPIKIDLPDVCEQIKRFFDFVENHIENHPFYHLSCLYNLLWRIDESYSNIPGKYRKLQPSLSELSEYSDKNEPISYYASLCDMSEVNFRRLFKEYTNKSPIEYRNDIRLSKAKIKLQSGEYNVTETAEICGFTNLSYFIRLYKKKYGITPKKE